MSPPARPRARRDDKAAFFRAFLERPQHVASVIPSSRFLERRVVEVAEVAAAKRVVELGPGTGGTTRAILDALPADGLLLAIELNRRFVKLIKAIGDPRLAVHSGSAGNLEAALRKHGFGAPDVVISGIPFSTMSPEVGRQVIEAVHAALAPGGKFVAYQVRDRVHQLATPVFGPAHVELELLNVPPMRVYCWEKAG
jgi:phosphatidylethanolamine/phosphatidyl-N-methylethanolamine N-methyltransferase